MFTSNNSKDPEIEKNINNNFIDPFTIWLLRISSILIIIFFTGIIIGLPLIIALTKSQLQNIILSSKESLKALVDIYLN
tara:strand:- start:1484 stop:1720 length:237 start_codon:yes stop_codon:yes gene_type:complete